MKIFLFLILIFFVQPAFTQVSTISDLTEYGKVSDETIWEKRFNLVAFGGELDNALNKAEDTKNYILREILLLRVETILEILKYHSAYVPKEAIDNEYQESFLRLKEKNKRIRENIDNKFDLALISEALNNLAPDRFMKIEPRLILAVYKIFTVKEVSDENIEILLGEPGLFYYLLETAIKTPDENPYKEDLLIVSDLTRVMLFKRDNYQKITRLPNIDLDKFNTYRAQFISKMYPPALLKSSYWMNYKNPLMDPINRVSKSLRTSFFK